MSSTAAVFILRALPEQQWLDKVDVHGAAPSVIGPV
jgi:hypothetical protein